MPQTFVALQCAFCNTFQGQLDKKSKKFTCVVCNAKQSFRTIFAVSNSGKDIRVTVQQLNELRGAQDELKGSKPMQQGQLQGQLQQQQQQQQRQPPTQSWAEFAAEEGCDDDDVADDEAGFVTAVPDVQAGRKQQRPAGAGSQGGQEQQAMNKRAKMISVNSATHSMHSSSHWQHTQQQQGHPSRQQGSLPAQQPPLYKPHQQQYQPRGSVQQQQQQPSSYGRRPPPLRQPLRHLPAAGQRASGQQQAGGKDPAPSTLAAAGKPAAGVQQPRQTLPQQPQQQQWNQWSKGMQHQGRPQHRAAAGAYQPSGMQGAANSGGGPPLRHTLQAGLGHEGSSRQNQQPPAVQAQQGTGLQPLWQPQQQLPGHQAAMPGVARQVQLHKPGQTSAAAGGRGAWAAFVDDQDGVLVDAGSDDADDEGGVCFVTDADAAAQWA